MIIFSIFPASAWTFQLNDWCTHIMKIIRQSKLHLELHVYNARSKISFHKNICIYQDFILQGCVNTKVAFISRLFIVMGNPEVDYGYCSCKHSQNNIPSCLLCRVYTVHQCDDYCGDGGDQPV